MKKTEDLGDGSQDSFLYGSLVVLNNFCNSYSVKF